MAGVTLLSGLHHSSAAEAQEKRERYFKEKDRMLAQDIVERAAEHYKALPSKHEKAAPPSKKRTFTMMSEAGQGAYAKVSRATMKEGAKKEKIVAVKTTAVGDQQAILKADHEAEMMEKLKDAPHCPRLISAKLVKKDSDFSHELAMDFAEGPSLHTLSFQHQLSTRDLKAIILGILEHLSHLHSKKMVHGDLMPSNIHYDPKSRTVKVLDFGTCHTIGEDYATYIQTQDFRAPEIILGKRYDPRIDLWGLGCTLFRVLNRADLFQTLGKDGSLATSKIHMEMIVELIGLPTYSYLKDCKFAEVFFKVDHKNGKVLGLQWQPRKHGMREKIGLMDKDLFDLLKRMIAWERPTAETLLKHPFLADEVSFQLQAHVPPDRDIAFEFALPAQPPFLQIDAPEASACVHVPQSPFVFVTPVDKATGEKGTTLAVNAEKDDSITFNVIEDL